MVPLSLRQADLFPGVLSFERRGYSPLGYLRQHPASGWSVWQPIREWKKEVCLIAKTALDERVREAMALWLPEERVPPTSASVRSAMEKTPLVEVAQEDMSALSDLGVEVWTVGYQRGSMMLRVGWSRGSQARWLEEPRAAFFAPDDNAPPSGRPSSEPWGGWIGDEDGIDRVLRAISGSVLDEPSILLAHGVADELLAPIEERRITCEMMAEIDADPTKAAELCIASLKYGAEHDAWEAELAKFGAEPPVATTEAARAMASRDGPTSVSVSGVGTFWREEFPPLPLCAKAPSASFETLLDGKLIAPGGHRYVCRFAIPQI